MSSMAVNQIKIKRHYGEIYFNTTFLFIRSVNFQLNFCLLPARTTCEPFVRVFIHNIHVCALRE